MYNYGGYGGYGGGGGGSQQMMSSMSSSCMCFLIVAAIAFFMMNGGELPFGAQPTEPPLPPPPPETTAPADAVSGLDGTFMILYGGMALSVDGSCKGGKVLFRDPKDSKTAWNVRKVGTTSDGKDYYVLQSVYKSFNEVCRQQYLTAPLKCGGPPYLDAGQSSPTQFWFIVGSKTSGYTLQNMACWRARYTNSYLASAGQKRGGNEGKFMPRTGSSYSFETPFTG